MLLFLQGRQGEVKHIYRSFAFLHSRLMTENGGMFVCRTRHIVLAGGSRVSQGYNYTRFWASDKGSPAIGKPSNSQSTVRTCFGSPHGCSGEPAVSDASESTKTKLGSC